VNVYPLGFGRNQAENPSSSCFERVSATDHSCSSKGNNERNCCFIQCAVTETLITGLRLHCGLPETNVPQSTEIMSIG